MSLLNARARLWPATRAEIGPLIRLALPIVAGLASLAAETVARWSALPRRCS